MLRITVQKFVKIAMKNKFSDILILVFVAALLVGVFYLASVLREREEKIRSESPIVFCVPPKAPPENQECFFTTHIHYHVTRIENGREKDLPFEKGPLERFHTHFEKNKVHWHSSMPVDQKTKGFLETLTLADMLKDFNLSFERSVVEVNGEVVPNPENFILDLREEPHIKITLK